jgi:transposase
MDTFSLILATAALCIKPRGLLARRQAEKVDVLKQTVPIFACMRALAMCFRGLLRANAPDARDDWIRDAVGCGIYAMQKFVANLRHDIEAVRKAIRRTAALSIWSRM